MENVKLGGTMGTLGTDLNREYAWCLREVNEVYCICLHKRMPGGSSYFNEKDFVTAIPLERVRSCAKLLIRKKNE